MNRVLSILVLFVFLQTQAWALVGGPVYPTGTTTSTSSLTGTYAGVLVPDVPQTGTSLSGQAIPASITSIGLFTVGVPDVGLAQGAIVFFVNGDAYSGTITGVADPGLGTLVGIIDAQSNFILFDPNNPTVNFRIFAAGNLQTTITGNAPVTTINAGATRVDGTAAVNVSGGGPGYDGAFTYTVTGYKQSDTATIITTITTGGGGG